MKLGYILNNSVVSSCGLRNAICEIENGESGIPQIQPPQLLSYGEADTYCKSIGSKIITIESLKKHWDQITRDLIAETKVRSPDTEFQLDFWTSSKARGSLTF